jgi:uncharacterized protein YegP (UPF0339 family)
MIRRLSKGSIQIRSLAVPLPQNTAIPRIVAVRPIWNRPARPPPMIRGWLGWSAKPRSPRTWSPNDRLPTAATDAVRLCRRPWLWIGLPPNQGKIAFQGGQMAAKFVLKKGSTGKYRFNLVATNGQIIATSEAYESKASALKASSW